MPAECIGLAANAAVGAARRFQSRERTIEDIANRAWAERILVIVDARASEPRRPETIVLKDAPRSHRG